MKHLTNNYTFINYYIIKSLKISFYTFSLYGLFLLFIKANFNELVINRFFINLLFLGLYTFFSLFFNWLMLKLFIKTKTNYEKRINFLLYLSSIPSLISFSLFSILFYVVFSNIFGNNAYIFEFSVILAMILSSLINNLQLILIIPIKKEKRILSLVNYLGGSQGDYFSHIAKKNLVNYLKIYVVTSLKSLFVNILPLYLIINLGIRYYGYMPKFLNDYYPYFIINSMIGAKNKFDIAGDTFFFIIILILLNLLIIYLSRKNSNEA